MSLVRRRPLGNEHGERQEDRKALTGDSNFQGAGAGARVPEGVVKPTSSEGGHVSLELRKQLSCLRRVLTTPCDGHICQTQCQCQVHATRARRLAREDTDTQFHIPGLCVCVVRRATPRVGVMSRVGGDVARGVEGDVAPTSHSPAHVWGFSVECEQLHRGHPP